MLGIPIFCMIANDYAELYESYAEGRLLAHNSNLGRQMAKLAVKLGGLEEEEKTKKGRFSIFGN